MSHHKTNKTTALVYSVLIASIANDKLVQTAAIPKEKFKDPEISKFYSITKTTFDESLNNNQMFKSKIYECQSKMFSNPRILEKKNNEYKPCSFKRSHR